MHDKIAEMSGNPHVTRTHGTPMEHCPHETEGMRRAAKRTEELLINGKTRGY